MATQNYSKRETRYFIGRISRDNERETLRMETYNNLPSAIREDYDFGRGFKEARIANLGVQFFESYEENKGEGRDYWYFVESVTNVSTVVINDNTNEKVKEYFKNIDKVEESPEEPVEEPVEEPTE